MFVLDLERMVVFKLLGGWVGLSFPKLWPPPSVDRFAISLAAQART